MKMPSPPPEKTSHESQETHFLQYTFQHAIAVKILEKKSSSSFNDIFDMEVPPRFESVEGKVHELKKALNGMNETVPKKN